MMTIPKCFGSLTLAAAAIGVACGGGCARGQSSQTHQAAVAPASDTQPPPTPAPAVTPIPGPAAASRPAAAAPTQPASVTVRQLSFAGTGCPASTVAGRFPTDATAFFLTMTSFTAQASAGSPIGDSRKNCQVLLDLDYPTGWQYTVQSVEYTGHVTVEDGTTATAGSAYYFQGDTNTVRFGTVFDGPADRDFDVTDALKGPGELWSKCDATRALNLNLSIRVTAAAGQATGTATIGSATDNQAAATLLTLKWRQCP